MSDADNLSSYLYLHKDKYQQINSRGLNSISNLQPVKIPDTFYFLGDEVSPMNTNNQLFSILCQIKNQQCLLTMYMILMESGTKTDLGLMLCK